VKELVIGGGRVKGGSAEKTGLEVTEDNLFYHGSSKPSLPLIWDPAALLATASPGPRSSLRR
jgi:hypothetical protein